LYSSKQFQVEFKISKFQGKVRQHVSQMSDRSVTISVHRWISQIGSREHAGRRPVRDVVSDDWWQF